MGEEKEVKLHGMWASRYSIRVEIALKIKGIPYEYVEEDLNDKSELLLKYNPIHKKVPVLVHKGKPLAESLVILNYIEDVWKDVPLMPEDPYKRAMVRFWSSFLDQQVLPSGGGLIKFDGEEQQKAAMKFQENLRLFEEGIAKEFSSGDPFFNGQSPGILDIVMASSLCSFRAYEEATGFKVIQPDKNPILHRWLSTLSELEAVKETLPDHNKHVERIRQYRAKFLQSAMA